MSKALIETSVYELEGPRVLVQKVEALDPNAIEENSVLARTLVTAISPGTEVAAYIGSPPLRPGKIYPRLIGYCNIAEVIGVGSNVFDTKLGDRIATFQSHRSAFVCKESEILTVVPEGADLGAVATTYLFHLGYHALLRGEMRPGLNVGIIGLGTLGMGAIAVASHSGAEVFGFSNQAASAELGRALGAREIFDRSASNAISKINDHTGGTGIDLVVTTSNSWDDWQLALNLARPGGTIAVVGFPGRGEKPPSFNPLDSQFLYDKQLTIVGCGTPTNRDLSARELRFTLKRTYRYLVDLIVRDELPARRLVSETVHWYQLGEIYERMANREVGLFTCLLDWQ